MFAVNAAIRHKDDRETAGTAPNLAMQGIASLPRRLGFNLGPRPRARTD
jgi:hypothetical protein